MHTKIELDKGTLEQLIDKYIKSLERANTKEINPLMKELRQKDIATLTNAKRTASEAR